MAISETSLRDAAQMAVDEINAAGGVLGRPIEPVIADGGSNWHEVVSIAALCAAVVATTLLAAAVPAVRAGRADPATVLRA